MRNRLLPLVFVFCCSLGTASAAEGDGWSHFGGSEKGQQYSSLTQITPANVSRLKEAWRFRTGELPQDARHAFAFQANPILVEGRLYLSTGSAKVFALDPATGHELWRFDAGIDRNKWYDEKANRGVSSWVDPDASAADVCRHRIYVGTLDARLIALDGETGEPCVDFAESGTLWLNRGIGFREDGSVHYTITSPPVVIGSILVTGSAVGDNRDADSELGIVRGIDARNGTELWRWDPIPRSADNPAMRDWDIDAARRTGSANAWAPLAADPALGLVYVPTGSASPDFYGGERIGDNRNANSLVALDASTGKVRWAQQLVHHDVWDYDLASQPTLVELRRGNKTIPAVLQGTKTGMIFTFDRRDGTPLFDIEERPVPQQGGVAGEQLSPTQPFPVAPPPLVRQGPVTADDAWGMLYFDRLSCRKRIASMRSEGIFTPPSIEGTIEQPGYAGGINWGGLAFEPATQYAVALTMNLPMEVALIPRDDFDAVRDSGDYDDYEFARQTGTPYAMRRRVFAGPLGLPCVRPPWGELTAVNMTTGKIAWQRKIGTIQDVAPALAPNLELGMPGSGGPIVTASGLVFIAAVMDNYLRAYDLRSGNKLWEGRLPAGGQATPMTYQLADS
ncbi:MAG: pyrroloquinoline quinone-dependent dehydrogenase, partial [Halioglobus sp.]|nr:pyrroloquinoline quinone-dependent dehydrogenase [Halioglobus sp.]